MTSAEVVVRAAGGVVLRDGDGSEPEVVLVHRPRYDDWSLPKGKCEPGEDDECCAVREVAEETGLVCRPVCELSTVHYRDSKGRPKVVRYWIMRVVSGEAAAVSPNEVDQVVWLPASSAGVWLSYGRDVSVVKEALARR